MIASGINIGRRRGEFEQATRTMRSVTGGFRHPAKAGICEISRLADLAARAAAKFCSQDKNGRIAKGVPDERWMNDNPTTPEYQSGFTGRALPAEMLHVFFCETVDTTLRGGHVFIKRGDRVLAWCEPELFAWLGQGYRLTIRFDPSEPTLGAAIFNREVGARNRDGFALGQFLGLADYAPEAPQVVTGQGFLTEEEMEAKGFKKRFASAVRTEYRAIGVFGKRKASASSARDGLGNVVTISNISTGGEGSHASTPTLPSRGSLSPSGGVLQPDREARGRGLSSPSGGESILGRDRRADYREAVRADVARRAVDLEAREAELMERLL